MARIHSSISCWEEAIRTKVSWLLETGRPSLSFPAAIKHFKKISLVYTDTGTFFHHLNLTVFYVHCMNYSQMISNLNFPGSPGSGGCLITSFPAKGMAAMGVLGSWIERTELRFCTKITATQFQPDYTVHSIFN